MGETYIQKLDEMGKIITQIPVNKMVFWIGAGIDSGGLTSLPLGNELTDYILQLTCGEKEKKIIEVWEQNAGLLKAIVGDKAEISNRPRLETIIEAVREFENHQLDKCSVLKGLCSFSAKELAYNDEHIMLAHYLHMGANIVTTNYGDFICKAYEEIYGRGQIVHEYTDMHRYSVSNGWGSCIYHIHGISSDLETIGASLGTVKNSLPNSFKERFTYWLKNGYTIIYMGYSGLDTLDVNPFLHIFCNNKKSSGIYIRHSTTGDFLPVSDKEEVLLYPFGNKYVCPCVTSDFLKMLSIGKPIKKMKTGQKSDNWKTKFLKYATAYDEERSNAFLSGLCYHLGIPITEIFRKTQWLSKVLQSRQVDDWYKRFYSFGNATMIGQQKIVKQQGNLLRNGKDELMESDYKAAVDPKDGKVKRPDEILLHDIEEMIEAGQVIGWEISTRLNRYVEFIYENTVRDSVVSYRSIKEIDEESIVLARRCLSEIIAAGYDAILEVNQINTAYRTLALCQSILKEEIGGIIENIDVSIRNYADVSSLNGVAMTLLYKAMVYLMDYEYNCDLESMKSAGMILKQAHEVIHGCKLRKYYRRCFAAEVWRIKLVLNIGRGKVDQERRYN